jgi:hypothetical protein
MAVYEVSLVNHRSSSKITAIADCLGQVLMIWLMFSVDKRPCQKLVGFTCSGWARVMTPFLLKPQGSSRLLDLFSGMLLMILMTFETYTETKISTLHEAQVMIT